MTSENGTLNDFLMDLAQKSFYYLMRYARNHHILKDKSYKQYYQLNRTDKSLVTRQKLDCVTENDYVKCAMSESSHVTFGFDIFAKKVDRVVFLLDNIVVNTFYNVSNFVGVWEIDFKDFMNNCDFFITGAHGLKGEIRIYGEDVSDVYENCGVYMYPSVFLGEQRMFEYLLNYETQYNVDMNSSGLRMYSRMPYRCFINELRFKFDKSVDFNKMTVYLFYKKKYEKATTVLRKDLIFYSDREFVYKDFFVSLLAVHDFVIMFDKPINAKLILTTKHYNLVRSVNKKYKSCENGNIEFNRENIVRTIENVDEEFV